MDRYDIKPVNWWNITRALDFYKAVGYEYVELPWIVGSESVAITKPKDSSPLIVSWWHGEIGELPGSAEQAFLEQFRRFEVTKRFVAATPCFRDEPMFQYGTHQLQFFKVELFQPVSSMYGWRRSWNMLEHARALFKLLGAKAESVTHPDGDGWDLMVNGIEVGSYGIREHKDMTWLYGTGIAEPRFTFAQEHPCKT